MKTTARISLALVAVVACAAATAQPYDKADQERRERNREEVMAKHGDTSQVSYRSAETPPQTLREKTHRVADKTRSFTHRQAEKMRRFGERQNQRYGKGPAPQRTPENNGPQ